MTADDPILERGDARWAGDTHDRLLTMLAGIEESLTSGYASKRPLTSAEALAGIVTGLDLATARLVVASLDLQGVAASPVASERHAR